VLKLQLEVGQLASLPDQIEVGLERMVRRDLRRDRAVFDRPEAPVGGLPAIERLAVEKRAEPDRFRTKSAFALAIRVANANGNACLLMVDLSHPDP
jgi:hypothetical protein